jgi:hypothetical protein
MGYFTILTKTSPIALMDEIDALPKFARTLVSSDDIADIICKLLKHVNQTRLKEMIVVFGDIQKSFSKTRNFVPTESILIDIDNEEFNDSINKISCQFAPAVKYFFTLSRDIQKSNASESYRNPKLNINYPAFIQKFCLFRKMLDQAMKLTEQFDCNTEITKKLLSYLT